MESCTCPSLSLSMWGSTPLLGQTPPGRNNLPQQLRQCIPEIGPLLQSARSKKFKSPPVEFVLLPYVQSAHVFRPEVVGSRVSGSHDARAQNEQDEQLDFLLSLETPERHSGDHGNESGE